MATYPEAIALNRCAARSDRGSGTVLMTSVLAVAVLGLLILGSVSQAVLARRGAGTAADLAALAAASQLLERRAEGAGSCPPALVQVASRVGAANSGLLTSCQIGADGSVTVSVAVPLTGWLASLGPVRASARAGLPPPDG